MRLYGPCMIMVGLLGVNPIAAFPIMMVSACAFLMPIAALRSVRFDDAFSMRAALGLTLSRIPGVYCIAAFSIKQDRSRYASLDRRRGGDLTAVVMLRVAAAQRTTAATEYAYAEGQ